MEGKEIRIAVTDPEMHTDAAISYVTYQVAGHDGKAPFSIKRRYRDFHLLREKLVERWPGLYVPPISSKKAAGNTEDRFVVSRRKFLNYFCEKISQRAYFFHSDIFQIFIRGAGDFEKSAKQLEPLDYEKLSQIYQKHFTELTQESSPAQLQMSTQSDYQFMKLAEKNLQKLREQFRMAAQAKWQYEKQFNFCLNEILPEYEEKVLLKYVEDDRSKLLLKENEKFGEKLEEYEGYVRNNVMDEYVELISYELREMRAFVEAINNRKKAEDLKAKMESKRRSAKKELQKLKQGETTIKSVFTVGSKDEQISEIENLIPKWEKSEQGLNNMIYLMNAAIYHELALYKKQRSESYKKDVRTINKKQIKEMNIYGSLLAIPLGVDLQ